MGFFIFPNREKVCRRQLLSGYLKVMESTDSSKNECRLGKRGRIDENIFANSVRCGQFRLGAGTADPADWDGDLFDISAEISAVAESGVCAAVVFSKDARKTSRGSGDISPFSALMTALAATIGTGNIVGVATAMVLGGPGALVWMWICALFGLTTKYSECMLAVKYRETNGKGEMIGGPMCTMKNGFKIKWLGKLLAFLFALFTVLASFGIGNMTQANSISDAIHSTFHVPTWITGAVITVLALIILVGGITSISRVSSVVVPVMAIFYTIGGIICIIGNIQNLPSGLTQIFRMAFSPAAVAGGIGGTITVSMMQAMRWGAARGVFSNEAGLGSAAITAAAATTTIRPVRAMST